MRVRDNSYANVYPEYGIPSDVCGTMSEAEKARRRTARAKKDENEKIYYRVQQGYQDTGIRRI